jgi:ferritin-like metal-binding protein YciE
MNVNTAEEMYIGELRDVYHAEKQLVEALAKLVEDATNFALKATLTGHLEAAEAHVNRLAEAFELLDGGRHCEAARSMSGGLSGRRGLEVGHGR